jgi:mRNA interferase RelE/StbE
MRLLFEKPALSALRRMQPKLAAAIVAAMERVAADPFGGHPNARKLKGTKDSFRLRHGDWRVLYRIDRAAGDVVVEDILKREEAYR